MSDDQLAFSREVQEVIDEHVRSKDYGGRIQELMLTHFREDWERIVDGRFELTMDEFIARRRALPRESLKGDYVKSFGEKVIANALFEHGIDYRYESNIRWDDVNYRPDFKIPMKPKSDIIIEYFGLNGDADYDEMTQQKRRFWSNRNEIFLEFSPNDLARNGLEGFIQLLLRSLKDAGVSYCRRTEKEIWELIKTRALDRFTTAMRGFVSRCRKHALSLKDLIAMKDAHATCSMAEDLFLHIGASVYPSYLQRLKLRNKDDFDGLMWRAVSAVRKKQTRFVRNKGKERGDVGQLKFIMVDEFQDFSQVFFELLSVVRSANRDVQYFCVGDDWQAINGFAGSDLHFFEGFSTLFQNTAQCYIRTNYRSPRLVVEVGNALMEGHGPAAKPERTETGRVWLLNLTEFKPSASEQGRHNDDEITPATLRLVRLYLDRGLNVVVLSRRHGVPWYVSYDRTTFGVSDALPRFLEHLRSFLPEEDRGRITISTVHGYKGLEQSAVIVLDAIERSYPLIHPTWMFLRIFGDNITSIEEEERRLFYVAITRAKESLALLTETPRQSPYLIDIARHVHLNQTSWAEIPPAPSLDGPHVEIRVYAYELRDRLRSLGYRFIATGKYWRKSVTAEGFSFKTLIEQPWASGKVRIEIRDDMGQLLYQRQASRNL